MTRDFWTVFRYELLRNGRRTGYWFTSFALPVLLVLGVFGYQLLFASTTPDTPEQAQEMAQRAQESLGGDAALTAAGLVDLAGLDVVIPQRFTSLFTLYPTLAAAEAALNAGEIQTFYVIQPDYLETGAVQVVLPRINIGQINRRPLTAALVETLAARAPENTQPRLITPARYTITNTQLTSIGAGTADDTENSAILVVYVFAIALMLSLFMTNGYLMQTVIEEKETRLVEILVASIKPGDLLGAKILAMSLLGLAQMAVWLLILFAAVAIAGGAAFSEAVGLIATLANIRLDLGIIPLVLVFFILAYLLFAGMYAIVAALSNSIREGPQYAVFFTLPAVFPLYFITTFTNDPNGTLPTKA
jgi:ABC-2 type transport system permease protein